MNIGEMEDFYKEAASVRKAMRVYGGGFIHGLGNAMDYADYHNLHKIKATWPEDWKRYLEMSKNMEK